MQGTSVSAASGLRRELCGGDMHSQALLQMSWVTLAGKDGQPVPSKYDLVVQHRARRQGGRGHVPRTRAPQVRGRLVHALLALPMLYYNILLEFLE